MHGWPLTFDWWKEQLGSGQYAQVSLITLPPWEGGRVSARLRASADIQHHYLDCKFQDTVDSRGAVEPFKAAMGQHQQPGALLRYNTRVLH